MTGGQSAAPYSVALQGHSVSCMVRKIQRKHVCPVAGAVATAHQEAVDLAVLLHGRHVFAYMVRAMQMAVSAALNVVGLARQIQRSTVYAFVADSVDGTSRGVVFGWLMGAGN
ncbi:hypothetical protein OsI_32287 [Oryza sativa Indica Group]|uniref:Uncharacterized protein n=1 Tax=Oryza sativa subsp. indica TaxID=39946 RepID=A2Z3S2_ORYSI|nr:hypothetical protein OsI_32287 [Oryza sativa Indica Group]